MTTELQPLPTVGATVPQAAPAPLIEQDLKPEVADQPGTATVNPRTNLHEISQEESAGESASLLDRQIIKVMSRIPLYQVSQGVQVAQNMTRPAANVRKSELRPGMVFESMAKLRATGLQASDIEYLLNAGHLMRTTVAGYAMLDRVRPTPAVVGNTTGSREGDASKGIGDGTGLPRNTPGVKWGYNPDELRKHSLSTLQGMIAMNAPGAEMPKSKDAAIGFMSENYRG